MIWFKLTASFCSSPLSVVHCARHQVKIAWEVKYYCCQKKYNNLCEGLFAFYFGLAFTIVKCTKLNNSCKADLPQRVDLLWEKGSLGTGCGQKHTWDVTLSFVQFMKLGHLLFQGFPFFCVNYWIEALIHFLRGMECYVILSRVSQKILSIKYWKSVDDEENIEREIMMMLLLPRCGIWQHWPG